MADDGSQAPKERVNIVYKPATGGAQEEVELPLKQLVLGDFTLREDDTPLELRKPVALTKDTFDDVMRAQHLSLDVAVLNHLSAAAETGGSGESLAVSLRFQSLRDFSPDSVAEQVPELKQLVLLRDALKALKGPLGNVPEFRKRLQALVQDDRTRVRLMQELGLSQDTSHNSGDSQ
ncbi:type VI secretion system-associated protein [Pandoraea iniqua]|uniref:Type VI secretion system-associated protein n=1 Tax=Pandoraea iniqua TaxID=2508288 RepID=A0A5E4YDN0_9BURK|nr:type VI secretion system contractile sheath small subunit [Pandoraea iniqua]VVE46570.1 type VI secretion system-associated protein [Pandoraea iniqua]